MYTVSGEANFEMKYTGLTFGGFTHPSVARSLIEQPTNVEKVLLRHFFGLFRNQCRFLLICYRKLIRNFQHLIKKQPN